MTDKERKARAYAEKILFVVADRDDYYGTTNDDFESIEMDLRDIGQHGYIPNAIKASSETPTHRYIDYLKGIRAFS